MLSKNKAYLLQIGFVFIISSFAEFFLADAAKGAGKILGKILKLCAGSDSVIGIADAFIIFPAAYIAYIFFHIHKSFHYLFYRFKIRCTVLAKRAYIIIGELLALVDISADLANKAFLALGFGLWLNIILIIGICHCISIGDHS